MNSAILTLDTTQDAGRAVHGTVRPLVRISDLCAVMALANVETLRVEVEDGRVTLFADREDRRSGGWHGRAEISISGIAADREDDLADVLLGKSNAEAQRPAVAGTLPPLVGGN